MESPSKLQKVSDGSSSLDEIRRDLTVDDSTSKEGKFAWATVNNVHLPCLFRKGKKYVAVRIMEKALLDKYINALNSDLYSHTRVQAHFLTNSEANLLNEINYKHTNRAYGMEEFSRSDLITELKDAVKLYKFVKFCYNKISNIEMKIQKSKCDFIEIGSQIVPYINLNGDKYVPSLFFPLFSESLKSKCFNVESWDWAYLKFYCLIIGLKDTEVPSKSCPVVNVEEIKKLFGDTEECRDFSLKAIKGSMFLFRSLDVSNMPWYMLI